MRREVAAAAATASLGATQHSVLAWRLSLPRHASHGHPQPLALSAPVFEPELNVFGFQLRKLLAVGHAVEFLRVLEDEVVAGVGVDGEPLLQTRHLRHRVDEGPVSFAPLLRRAAAAQAARKGRHLHREGERKGK